MTDEEKIALIEQFYVAFQHLDSEGMASCYHDDIVFSDPAFGELSGDRVRNMWCMLCTSQKGKDFQVMYSAVGMNDQIGVAHWEAKYVFSKTGRDVHNKITAQFEFQDNKIIRHIDHFNLHKWATQALGFKGWLIGWTGFFKRKLNAQTNRLLTKFEQSQ